MNRLTIGKYEKLLEQFSLFIGTKNKLVPNKLNVPLMFIIVIVLTAQDTRTIQFARIILSPVSIKESELLNFFQTFAQQTITTSIVIQRQLKQTFTGTVTGLT